MVDIYLFSISILGRNELSEKKKTPVDAYSEYCKNYHQISLTLLVVGGDLMGVHWWAAARAESMSPTVRRMASVSGMMTSELLSYTAQLRHRVTSRHASHGPPSQHPQPGLPATLDLSLTSGLVSIEPIIHLHIFTPLHLQNSYSQTMSNVVMEF